MTAGEVLYSVERGRYVYERGNFGDRGLGWYWHDAEYPDEGSCGPFDTLGEAMVSASGGEDKPKRRREPPLMPSCKDCGAPKMPDQACGCKERGNR